jgi:hypothetical protein
LKILKFFDADPDPESFWPWIREAGWKKSGSGINIPDPEHCKNYFTLMFFRDFSISEGFEWVY